MAFNKQFELIHVPGGVRWLNNTMGDFAKAYRLYDGAGNDTTVFGKAGGIGSSFVLLSDPAPMEIGNRIWRDTTNNGVQDPGESGFPGVTDHLYNSLNALVGTAVTDVNGKYYFVSSTVVDPTPGDNIGQVNGGIFYNAGYSLQGRVIAASGNGIRNIRVYLSEGSGNVRTTLAGSFGTYRFDDIEAGQNVLVSIASKRYSNTQPIEKTSVAK